MVRENSFDGFEKWETNPQTNMSLETLLQRASYGPRDMLENAQHFEHGQKKRECKDRLKRLYGIAIVE